MSTSKTMTIEQLAKELARLSPKEYASLIELLDKENLRKRRTLVRRQIAKGQVVSERALFKGLS